MIANFPGVHFRIDFSRATGVLIVQCPSAAHEIGELIFSCAEMGPKENWPKESRDSEFVLPSPRFPNMESAGTATVDLQDKKKSADYSLFDATPGQNCIFRSYPTVVVEVAYTETSEKLAEDCGRWIPCSLGRVLLALAFDIKLKNQPKEKEIPVLSSVICHFWELVEAEILNELPKGATLDTLVRSDKNAKQAETYTGFGPATKYYCISYLGDKAGKPVYVKYHAGITASYQV